MSSKTRGATPPTAIHREDVVVCSLSSCSVIFMLVWTFALGTVQFPHGQTRTEHSNKDSLIAAGACLRAARKGCHSFCELRSSPAAKAPAGALTDLACIWHRNITCPKFLMQSQLQAHEAAATRRGRIVMTTNPMMVVCCLPKRQSWDHSYKKSLGATAQTPLR